MNKKILKEEMVKLVQDLINKRAEELKLIFKKENGIKKMTKKQDAIYRNWLYNDEKLNEYIDMRNMIKEL